MFVADIKVVGTGGPAFQNNKAVGGAGGAGGITQNPALPATGAYGGDGGLGQGGGMYVSWSNVSPRRGTKFSNNQALGATAARVAMLQAVPTAAREARAAGVARETAGAFMCWEAPARGSADPSRKASPPSV